MDHGVVIACLVGAALDVVDLAWVVLVGVVLAWVVHVVAVPALDQGLSKVVPQEYYDHGVAEDLYKWGLAWGLQEQTDWRMWVVSLVEAGGACQEALRLGEI